jgi:hypothetical protein
MKAACQGCGAPQEYGRIRCTACGQPLVFPEKDDALMVQRNAAKRGNLNIWTIFDKPRDYPHGHIARRFEIGSGQTIATDDSLVGELEELRQVFWQAGLMKLSRSEGDEPQVVESWV